MNIPQRFLSEGNDVMSKTLESILAETMPIPRGWNLLPSKLPIKPEPKLLWIIATNYKMCCILGFPNDRRLLLLWCLPACYSLWRKMKAFAVRQYNQVHRNVVAFNLIPWLWLLRFQLSHITLMVDGAAVVAAAKDCWMPGFDCDHSTAFLYFILRMSMLFSLQKKKIKQCEGTYQLTTYLLSSEQLLRF